MIDIPSSIFNRIKTEIDDEWLGAFNHGEDDIEELFSEACEVCSFTDDDVGEYMAEALSSGFWSTHRDYMASTRWMILREYALQQARYKCSKCGKRGFQVHHKSYRNVGSPREISDLVVVCSSCHQQIHRRRFND